MKRLTAIAVCLGLCIGMTGCMTMKVEAPAGTRVMLASDVEAQPVVESRWVWFALWGLVPVSNNSTKAVVQRENLAEVSVLTKHTFLNYLVSAFTGYISLVPMTVEVHGKQATTGASIK